LESLRSNWVGRFSGTRKDPRGSRILAERTAEAALSIRIAVQSVKRADRILAQMMTDQTFPAEKTPACKMVPIAAFPSSDTGTTLRTRDIDPPALLHHKAKRLYQRRFICLDA
jgi:hypothetical protein